MKNKKINKLLAISMATGILFTSLTNSVHALDKSVDLKGNSFYKQKYSSDFKIDDLKEYYSKNNLNYREFEDNQGNIGLTISDYEIYRSAEEAGYNIDKSVLNSRAKGVTKIVWRKGGFDLYLSKNTLLLVAGAGIGAISALLAPLAPIVVGTISGAIGMYVGGNISDGRVFRFVETKEKGKYIFQKSWKQ